MICEKVLEFWAVMNFTHTLPSDVGCGVLSVLAVRSHGNASKIDHIVKLRCVVSCGRALACAGFRDAVRGSAQEQAPVDPAKPPTRTPTDGSSFGDL